jgi:hypothetical protein
MGTQGKSTYYHSISIYLHDVDILNRSPGSDNTSADNEADQYAAPDASPDLTNQSLANGGIVFRPQSLLQEREEHGDNDASL